MSVKSTLTYSTGDYVSVIRLPVRQKGDRPVRSARNSQGTNWVTGDTADRYLELPQQPFHQGAGFAEVHLAGIALLERAHGAAHIF